LFKKEQRACEKSNACRPMPIAGEIVCQFINQPTIGKQGRIVAKTPMQAEH